MSIFKINRFVVATVLAVAIGMFVMAESFAQNGTEKKAMPPFHGKNLKVLPKNTTGEQIHDIMMTWSKSLGVRCNYCHVPGAIVDGKPQMDFASDNKSEKLTARKMLMMTMDINKKYIAKMGDMHLNNVTCATCHMGKTTPLTSVDSLPKKE